jgi:hypothetical protein
MATDGPDAPAARNDRAPASSEHSDASASPSLPPATSHPEVTNREGLSEAVSDQVPSPGVAEPAKPAPGNNPLVSLFTLISGFLLGLVGLYTNFFSTWVQVSAVAFDLLTGAAIVTIIYTWRTGGNLKPLLDFKARPGWKVILVWAAALLLIGANIVGFFPPRVEKQPSTECYAYNVLSQDGVSVPIQKGGGIQQVFKPTVDYINSVSVIIGLDPRLANIHTKHPVKLVFRSTDLKIQETLRREDIVNNSFSRFDFRRPLKVENNQVFEMQIYNESEEPIGIYVKKPGAMELAPGVGRGVVVVGQVDNQAEHEMTGYVLSGAVTCPG